jgi:signal transduction histidine kinase
VGWFDSNRLERVVANLVLNACEAVSPDLGRVVITKAGNQACLQIGVWNNGPASTLRIRTPSFNPL